MTLHDLLLRIAAGLAAKNCLGYIASAFVLATFSVGSMRALRCIAILSNLAFIAYAVAAGLVPILVLHSILLPTNVMRLAQLELSRRRSQQMRPELASLGNATVVPVLAVASGPTSRAAGPFRR
jgi:hypothetical protein